MPQRRVGGAVMRRALAPSSERGLTLVELAVAILVLSIGAIGALRAADQSRLAIGGAEDRMLAQLAARNRAEELRLYTPTERRGLPDSIEMGGQRITLITTTQQTAVGLTEATVVARAERGGGALYVIYLPVERRR